MDDILKRVATIHLKIGEFKLYSSFHAAVIKWEINLIGHALLMKMNDFTINVFNVKGYKALVRRIIFSNTIKHSHSILF